VGLLLFTQKFSSSSLPFPSLLFFVGSGELVSALPFPALELGDRSIPPMLLCQGSGFSPPWLNLGSACSTSNLAIASMLAASGLPPSR
jgi:hypothetical protein